MRSHAPRLAALLRRRKRAVILILVLWIAVILSLLAYSSLYQASLENRIVTLRRDTLEAEALARAGIARAYTDLRNDLIFDQADDEDGPFDAEGDPWARMDLDKEDFELGRGTFTVEVTDMATRFNINRMSLNNTRLLQTIIERIGYEEEDAEIVAAAIVDYMDGDMAPALSSSAAGDESIAWGVIRAEDLGESERPEDVDPLYFPNEPLITVDALLDVYGVTPELYFGPGTPEAEYYRELMGPNQGDRFQITNDRRRSRNDEPWGLRDYFTVWGGRQININTAPQHVLEALFDAGGVSDPERLAETVIRNRRGGRGNRIDNDRAYKSLIDLQEDAEVAAGVAAVSGLYPVNVQSFFFRVRSTGRVRQAEVTQEVVVLRGMVQIQIEEDFDAIDRSEERRERMEERTERRTDRDNPYVVRIPTIRTVQWIEP